MNETRNIIASLEFGEKESQICYYDRKEKNPVSLAVKTGTTEYTFPTRLSKRPKTNIWHFGAESEYFSKYEGEILVEDVLNLCMKGEPVEIDGEVHEVEELLEVFLKGCLSMLGVGEPQRQIKILMITTPNLNRVFIRKLQKVCRHLNFANGQVLIQGLYMRVFIIMQCVPAMIMQTEVQAYSALIKTECIFENSGLIRQQTDDCKS